MAIKKNRLVSVEERNEKIEHMGLAELKKYLCMKNYQNPEKCKDCPGKKNCKAGQRAIVLLSEREIRKMEEEKKSGTSSQKGKTVKERTEEARNKFIASCGQEDMIQYVMDHFGGNRNSARQTLKYWGNAYPDLAEQFDFWNRFNKLSGDIPEKSRDYFNKRKSDAIERYKEAAAQKDPISFMMEKYGISRKTANHNFRQWVYRYGEIKQEDLKMEEDEVSVADFLNEVETSAGTMEDKASVVEEIEADKATDFYGELNAKFYELEKEKERLKERIAWIEKAQDALAMTAKLFNEESA